MTASFNLSQLANNLNTSGRLDATDGLYGVLPPANGGTGQSSLTANNVLLGNGTSGVQTVAPGASGNVLISNGSTWTSGNISSVSGFGKSFATNGYQYLPSGMLMQWMRQNGVNVSTNYTINFPVAFANDCLNIQITSVTNDGSSFVPTIVSYNASSVTYRWERPSGGFNPANFFIFAIGY